MARAIILSILIVLFYKYINGDRVEENIQKFSQDFASSFESRVFKEAPFEVFRKYIQGVNFINRYINDSVEHQQLLTINRADFYLEKISCFQSVFNLTKNYHENITKDISNSFDYFQSSIIDLNNDEQILRIQFDKIIESCYHQNTDNFQLNICNISKLDEKVSAIENSYDTKIKLFNEISLEKRKLEFIRLSVNLFLNDAKNFVATCNNVELQSSYKLKKKSRISEIRDVIKNIETANLSDYNQLKDIALFLIKANYKYYKSIINSTNGVEINNCYEYYNQKLSQVEKKAEIHIMDIHKEFMSTLTNKELFNEMHQRMTLSMGIFNNTNEILTLQNLVDQVFKIYDYEKFKSNILGMRLITFKKRINDEVIDIFNARVIESLKFYDLCRSIH